MRVSSAEPGDLSVSAAMGVSGLSSPPEHAPDGGGPAREVISGAAPELPVGLGPKGLLAPTL
eukprot:9500274-Pyramimonas_sp.AAC.1